MTLIFLLCFLCLLWLIFFYAITHTASGVSNCAATPTASAVSTM